MGSAEAEGGACPGCEIEEALEWVLAEDEGRYKVIVDSLFEVGVAMRVFKSEAIYWRRAFWIQTAVTVLSLLLWLNR